MSKKYLPLTVQNAELIKINSEPNSETTNQRNFFISVKKLQTDKASPKAFYRPISKIINDDL